MTKCGYFLVCLVVAVVCGAVAATETRCEDDGLLPEKLQTALTACQDDLESLITHGFFHGLADMIQAGKAAAANRTRRAAQLPGRQEIAGCMLLCMFRKLKMVDENEVPTVEGLIKYFGEGVKQRGYFLAMTQAVQQCVTVGRKQSPSPDSATHKCVVSYRIFDCIRGEIMEYCQGSR